jgi:hypothetical protein
MGATVSWVTCGTTMPWSTDCALRTTGAQRVTSVARRQTTLSISGPHPTSPHGRLWPRWDALSLVLRLSFFTHFSPFFSSTAIVAEVGRVPLPPFHSFFFVSSAVIVCGVGVPRSASEGVQLYRCLWEKVNAIAVSDDPQLVAFLSCMPRCFHSRRWLRTASTIVHTLCSTHAHACMSCGSTRNRALAVAHQGRPRATSPPPPRTLRDRSRCTGLREQSTRPRAGWVITLSLSTTTPTQQPTSFTSAQAEHHHQTGTEY